MKSTAVTWAVLGLIALEPRSGYDVKRIVDRTIRYFWAASYGQIYPELRRLEEAGWITGEDASSGGRRRRLYRITPAGREGLREWQHGGQTRIELRDESLLRLLFADMLPREDALGILRARRERYRQILGYLRRTDAQGKNPPFADLVYRWALETCEWEIEWCDRQEHRLRLAA